MARSRSASVSVDITSYDAKDLAHQLTQLEHAVFSSVKPLNYYEYVCMEYFPYMEMDHDMKHQIHFMIKQVKNVHF